MAQEAQDKRRKYPRIKVGKGMFVGWKSLRQRTVSRAQEMGLGGVFLFTKTPAPIGTNIELIFDVPGGEVRARAAVRHIKPGVGMGLQFVNMRPEHRERLNRYLMTQMEEPVAAANAADAAAAEKKSARSKGGATGRAGDGAGIPKSEKGAEQTASARPAGPAKPTEQPSFKSEVEELLDLAHRGTHYQILGVSADSTAGQVKKNFYLLAQKFHPDHHMEEADLAGPLQKLMEAATKAYKTLSDEKARTVYDKALADSAAFRLHRARTEAQETVDDCMTKAKECLRAGNFVGSVVWLRKCVTIAPNDATYHALLARSLSTVAQYRNEALEHFDQAIEIDPWNVRIYFHYAEACEEMELPSRARGLYAKILEIDPTHVKSLERLAEMDAREREAEPASVISRMFGRKG